MANGILKMELLPTAPQNNTLAIFYAQTDNPNLTMDVIRIGRVRCSLSRFHKLGQHITFAIQ